MAQVTKWTVLGTAFSLLTPLVVRAAQSYALTYFEQWLANHPLAPPGGREQAGSGRPASEPATSSDHLEQATRLSLNSLFKESVMSLYPRTRPGLDVSDGEEQFPVGDGVRIFADEARLRLAEAGAMINTVVTTRPALALGAALAAGVVVGWLIKRR